MDTRHRIWMDAVSDGKRPLDGGWYGKPSGGGSVNQPIYWRVSDEKDAVVFPRHTTIAYVRDMRRLGYPCHAVPPIHIRETI